MSCQKFFIMMLKNKESIRISKMKKAFRNLGSGFVVISIVGGSLNVFQKSNETNAKAGFSKT